MEKTKINVKSVIDVLLVILLAILSIKKGGFYKSDSLFFYVFVIGISIIYMIYCYIDNKKKFKSKTGKVDIVGILLLALSFSYSLPVIFGNFASMSGSLFEIMRYFCIYLIYKIVRGSQYPKMYLNSIIVITVIQCVIGIDGIANRLLENILGSVFSSGYLSIDLTRMSGTIQYANVFAILCAMSGIVIFDKLIHLKVESTKHKIKYAGLFAVFFILCSSIVISMSRTVLVILAICIVIYLIKNKGKLLHCILALISQAILITIYTSCVFSYIQVSPSKIYITFAIFVILACIIGYVIITLKDKLLDKKVNKYSLGIICACVGVAIIYLVIGLNIDKPLKVSSNDKQDIIERKLYNVNKGVTNNLAINVSTLQDDSRYKINVFSIDKDFNMKQINTFNYYDNVSGNFEFNFMPDENIRALSIQIQCDKGSIQIDNASLNNQRYKLEYSMLPTDFVLRIKDALQGSSSLRDRVSYIQDSVKIVTATPQNFIFGVGGDGFENLYNRYQDYYYVSTEVHNSYIQIFVESGILGFLCIVSIVIIAFKKCKFNSIAIALFAFVLHSMFDLNFSFLITMCVFGIFVALLEEKENKEAKDSTINYVLNSSEMAISCIMLVVTMYISAKAYMAYSIKVPKLTTNSTQQVSQIDEVVDLLEDKVNLDGSDFDYRFALNEAYNIYVKLISNTITSTTDSNTKALLQVQLVNVLNNLKTNADSMLENDRYNKNAVLSVCNIYFKNLGYFVAINYDSNNELGYKEYLNFILNNLKQLDEIKYNSVIKEEIKNTYTNYYEQLKKANQTIESNEIENVLKQIEVYIK